MYFSKTFKNSFSVRNFIILSKPILLLFMVCCFCGPKAFSSEKTFFSYKRFFISEDAVSGGKDQGLIQRDLESFVRKFNEGLYNFSRDNYSEAQKSLQEARQLWPEYYATDFLLAQAYEQIGQYKIAARYYKSYLNKLNKLRSGSYRLTGPLMISFNSQGIEENDDAYMYVKNRLDEYGIDIDKVVPAFDPPGSFLYLIIIIAVISGMVILYRKLCSYWRKIKRRIDAPEGFWACRNCGTYNPDLRNECEECGQKIRS